jgi:hypothetical protein
MKKILSIFIAIVFIMSAGAGSAFASNGDKHGSKKVSYDKSSYTYKQKLKDLKDKYKKERNSLTRQEQLLKDIAN